MPIMNNKPASMIAGIPTTISVDIQELRNKVDSITSDTYWENLDSWDYVVFVYENSAGQSYKFRVNLPENTSGSFSLPTQFRSGVLKCQKIVAYGYVRDSFFIGRSDFASLFGSESAFDFTVISSFPEAPAQISTSPFSGVSTSFASTGASYYEGAQGPKGDKGDKGDPGEMGPPGPAGSGEGSVGPAGPQGPQGPQGLKGDKGDEGEMGPSGLQGPQGEKGEQGEIGPIGLAGPQGLKGDKGDAGEAGPQGPQGEMGPQGIPGERGLQGDKGDKGDQGERGLPGEMGPQGSQGQTGPQGQQGPQGEVGPQGPKGDKGDAATLKVSEISGQNITNEIEGVSTIRFDKDTGFNVQDLGNGEIKVALNSTFKTWEVDGQDSLVAVGEDTVEFVAGSGVQITTDPNASPKSITISATGGGGSSAYDGSPTTTVSVGGLAAGTNISSLSLSEIIQSIVSPYVAPAFSSFSINQSSPLEVGASISGNKSFSFGFSQAGNVKPNSVEILDANNQVMGTFAVNGSPASVNIGTIQLNAPGSYSWKARATNTQNAVFNSGNATVSWAWRLYSGTSNSAVLNESAIKALSNSNLSGAKNATYSMAAGGYKYFCWPDSFGSPTAVTGFKDTATNLSVSMADSSDNASFSNVQNGWSYAIVSVTNVNGVTTNYRVYRTKNILGGSINIQVS